MNGKALTADIELRKHQSTALDRYMCSIIHQWSQTLCALGFILVPLFHILDWVMMPRELLPRFAAYRFVTTLIVFAQYIFLYHTKPSRFSLFHGYFFSAIVGLCIALMTHDLGGFNSTYYAGLNLVMIAVCLLLPWDPVHSAVNAVVILLMYVSINALSGNDFTTANVVNNLYFMSGTAVIAVSINYVKQRLIKEEFYLRAELATARDALWGEMEVAKRIQTALLPNKDRVGGYVVAATMLPAEEVGGDYYDVIDAETGENWVAIGDVSGHGVESGLIMMMSQTSIYTTVNRTAGYKPSTVLNIVNSVLKQNINRLGTDRYMTCSVLRLEHDKIVFAGKHQDLVIHRSGPKRTEFVPSKGTWIGILDEIGDYLTDSTVPVEDGDLILLYTDGLTEATNERGEMYGEMRLLQKVDAIAEKTPDEIVRALLHDVREHMSSLRDDITIVALRRTDDLADQDTA